VLKVPLNPNQSINQCLVGYAQIPLGLSRHDILSSPYSFAKVVTRRVALVGHHGTTRSSRQARLARHVFRGVAVAWTGVHMSTSLFPEVVPEIDANSEHKRLNLYTQALALLLLSRPPCWIEHGSTRSSHIVVSCRDKPSGIWALVVMMVICSPTV